MATVKTEILCPEHWDNPLNCMMAPVTSGEHVYMEFTLTEYGRIEGMFEVENRIHLYTDDKGYKQRVQLRPIS